MIEMVEMVCPLNADYKVDIGGVLYDTCCMGRGN